MWRKKKNLGFRRCFGPDPSPLSQVFFLPFLWRLFLFIERVCAMCMWKRDNKAAGPYYTFTYLGGMIFWIFSYRKPGQIFLRDRVHLAIQGDIVFLLWGFYLTKSLITNLKVPATLFCEFGLKIRRSVISALCGVCFWSRSTHSFGGRMNTNQNCVISL